MCVICGKRSDVDVCDDCARAWDEWERALAAEPTETP